MLLGQSSSSSDAAVGFFVLVVWGLLFLLSIAVFAFHIYVLVDILKYSDAVWQAAGQNKGLWIGLWVLAFCCGGIIIDLIYWFVTRPKLQAVEASGGGYGGGYGGGGGYPNYPG